MQRRLSSDRDHRGSEPRSARQSSQRPGSGFRIFAEEVLTNVSAVFGFEGLVVAVNGFVHQLNQLTAGVFTQQLIPTAAPDNLDNVPASTTEDAFQFVNDFAVTGDRAVQTLQVAVDDEDQVVQFSRVAMVIAPLIPAHPSRRRP